MYNCNFDRFRGVMCRCRKRLLLLLVSGSIFLWTAQCQLIEGERVEEYIRQGHTWPLLETEFVPSTVGWKKLLQRRLDQVDLLSDHEHNSYDAYLSTLSSALIHNFTKYGFGKTRGPPSAFQLIQDFIRSSIKELNESTIALLPGEEPDEIAVDTLVPNDDDSTTSFRPKMLELPDSVKDQVLRTIQPLMEAWAGGIALEPFAAYGLRIYHNTSRLYMHLDHRATHVISAIFHIGHDNQKPWPLIIEDFEGKTNEVYLQPGEMLLYESSKCWHGRPRRMDGSWYTSLFVHFRPVFSPGSMDSSYAEYMEDFDWKLHHRVPPHWHIRHESSTNIYLESFVMPDTFAFEPDCPDGWCSLRDSVVIDESAPQEYGKVLSANGEVQDLQWTSRGQGGDEL